MKIYAPMKDFNGLRVTVNFVNGVGETNNPRLIKWFKNHGYRVEESVNLVIEHQNDAIESQNDQIEPNFESMTPNELREWMKAHGLGSQIKNIRNKEKLLEIIRG